jgi:hypothetical protein
VLEMVFEGVALQVRSPLDRASRTIVAGCNTGTEAGAPPMSSRGIQLEGHRPRCPRVQKFRACDVAGCESGTGAGAPPITSRGIQLYDPAKNPPASGN